MKILAAIANYGTENDRYLARVVEEYRGMRDDVDIVVTSNIPKNLGRDVEVVVGLPSKDPWSLGFAHKRIFAERSATYDLYIYSEDDILIGQKNINAFLRMTGVLPENELAGFFRSETGSDGTSYFPDVHAHYHWQAASVCNRRGYTFAFFTNEHAACYVLTREQLRRAIESGGFLVGPHEGRYDLLCAAATDPYTQCGFKKMVCISHLQNFVVRHLSNKYVGRIGVRAAELQGQVRILLGLAGNATPRATLFPVETRVYHQRWSKSYYESCQDEMLALVPEGARNILSIGCGWGATEKSLIEKGMRVKGVPIDSVIAASAESRGVEIVYGDYRTAREKLANERFDCLLFSNVLHLVRDPVEFLAFFAELLAPEGCVIASVPNLPWSRRLCRRIRLRGHVANPRSYDASGMHVTNGRVLRRWFRQAGLKANRIAYEILGQKKRADHLSFGLAKPIVSSNFHISGIRTRKHSRLP